LRGRGERQAMRIVESATRLYVLLALNGSRDVIFRRGPSDLVLLIKWNLDDDTFEIGQWLKGRVYERRCDLSPDGEMLLYFAANFPREYRAYSAISRPPYFTALAIWPKSGTHLGGGLFHPGDKIALDYMDWERMELAPGFSTPKWLTVEHVVGRTGVKECDPTSVFPSASPATGGS
jgi:hypothetical protein